MAKHKNFKEGDRVELDWFGSNEWYPGFILSKDSVAGYFNVMKDQHSSKDKLHYQRIRHMKLDASGFVLAAARGILPTVEQWIGQEGVGSIDSTDSNGATALQQACTTGQKEVVQYLLEQGASLTLRNRQGFSALELAFTNAKVQIIHQISKFTASIYGMSAKDEKKASVDDFLRFCDQNTQWQLGLDQVWLLPMSNFVDAERFLPHEECTDILVRADTVDLASSIVFISQRWAAPDTPDPNLASHELARLFLTRNHQRLDNGYVWVAYSCLNTSSEDEVSASSEAKRLQQSNIATAIAISSDCLILPGTTTTENGKWVTNLKGYLGRAACRTEALLHLVSGSSVHCAFSYDNLIKDVSYIEPQMNGFRSAGTATIPPDITGKENEQLVEMLQPFWGVDFQLNPVSLLYDLTICVMNMGKETFERVLSNTFSEDDITDTIYSVVPARTTSLLKIASNLGASLNQNERVETMRQLLLYFSFWLRRERDSQPAPTLGLRNKRKEILSFEETMENYAAGPAIHEDHAKLAKQNIACYPLAKSAPGHNSGPIVQFTTAKTKYLASQNKLDKMEKTQSKVSQSEEKLDTPTKETNKGSIVVGKVVKPEKLKKKEESLQTTAETNKGKSTSDTVIESSSTKEKESPLEPSNLETNKGNSAPDIVIKSSSTKEKESPLEPSNLETTKEKSAPDPAIGLSSAKETECAPHASNHETNEEKSAPDTVIGLPSTKEIETAPQTSNHGKQKYRKRKTVPEHCRPRVSTKMQAAREFYEKLSTPKNESQSSSPNAESPTRRSLPAEIKKSQTSHLKNLNETKSVPGPQSKPTPESEKALQKSIQFEDTFEKVPLSSEKSDSYALESHLDTKTANQGIEVEKYRRDQARITQDLNVEFKKRVLLEEKVESLEFENEQLKQELVKARAKGKKQRSWKVSPMHLSIITAGVALGVGVWIGSSRKNIRHR